MNVYLSRGLKGSIQKGLSNQQRFGFCIHAQPVARLFLGAKDDLEVAISADLNRVAVEKPRFDLLEILCVTAFARRKTDVVDRSAFAC